MRRLAMDKPIMVSGHNVELGDALREFAERKIEETAGKYFGRITEATVQFKKTGAFYACAIRFRSRGMQNLAAEHENVEIYTAFNICLEKLSKQLRRAKRQMREDKAQRPDKVAMVNEGLRAPPLPASDLGEEESYNPAAVPTDPYAKALMQASKADIEARHSDPRREAVE